MLDTLVLFVHRIESGEEYGVGVHNIDKHVITRRHRTAIVIKVTGQAKGHLSSLGHVDIDVGTHGVFLTVDIVVEAVAMVNLEHTAILSVGTRDIIGSHLTTTADRNIGTGTVRYVLEQHVVPVVGRIDKTVGTGLTSLLNLVLAVDEVINIQRTARNQSVVVTLHIGYRVSQLNLAERALERVLDTAEDLGGTFLTALGGNEDYTVSTAGTVEGSCRGVFQDRETLDIIGTQTVKVGRCQLDVIDKNKWVGTTLTKGCHTTNEEVGVVLTRLTRTCVSNHTGDVTGKRLGKVARRHTQIFGVYRGDRAHDTFLLLLTVGYDRYLVKLVALGGKLYIDNCLVSHGNDFVLHTYVGEHKFVGWLDFDFIATINVGHNTLCGFLDYYACAWQGFASTFLRDFSLDRYLLCQKRQRHEKQEKE